MAFSGAGMMTTNQAGSARFRAIAVIRAEHRALCDVMELLQRTLREIVDATAKPDFALLSAALYYIDDFACRCHHSKEDQHLFGAIRRHAPQAAATVNALESEHQGDDHFLKDLHRQFVLYQGGAPGALERLSACLAIYATMMYEHMAKEEALLDATAIAVPEIEWHAIAEGFAGDDDPLFGTAPRHEFERLRERITVLVQQSGLRGQSA